MPTPRRRRREHRDQRRAVEFTVVGIGPFPLDMLRWDLCYPKSEEDSASIEKTYQKGNRIEREITLASIKEPTDSRWRTFGWRVKHDE